MRNFADIMIYYFSGTGNTRWAAGQMAEALGCQAIDICRTADKELSASYERIRNDEPIGLAFPIHGWQPPQVMRRFISRLPQSILRDRYVFAMVTCGDDTGLALDMLRKQIAKKGAELAMAFSLIMPETYVCLPFMHTDTAENERRKKEDAARLLPEFAGRIMRREKGEWLTRGTMPWLLTNVIGAYFNRFMITDRKFHVDTDLCIHCGRCARECPVGDIIESQTTSDFTPQWKHNGSCTNCLSCFHHCPRHAINYGNITRKRGQYYYKDIS